MTNPTHDYAYLSDDYQQRCTKERYTCVRFMLSGRLVAVAHVVNGRFLRMSALTATQKREAASLCRNSTPIAYN